METAHSHPPCKLCGKPWLTRDLCSACYQKAKADGTLDVISPTPYTHCGECGDPIPAGRRWGARYCSAGCKNTAMDKAKRDALLASRAARPKLCGWCKNPLPPERNPDRARFCSRKCKDDWGNHQKSLSAARAKQEARQPCEVCGKAIPESRPANAIYCSPKCKSASRRTTSPKARRDQSAYNRLWRYGVTPEQWDAQMAAQDGRCAICRSADWPGKDNQPHADHDHDLPVFILRGILCGECNTGIGKLAHDPLRLAEAVVYLTRDNPAALVTAASVLRQALIAVVEAPAT